MEINRTEETKDKKVQIEIYNKETGEVIETQEKYYDEAERWANNKIWGRRYLGWRKFEITG